MKQSTLSFIKKIGRPVFTTAELATVSGKSLSATVQLLNYLEKQGVVFKIYRGVWSEVTEKPLCPYTAIPFLFPRHRVYVSFTSALHLYGIIEQIPQVITLASTMHTKKITTELGTFSVHQITPSFFDGFDWYENKKLSTQTDNFLIAEPEKALVDCLYLAGRKKKQFAHFPELYFPKTFSFTKTKKWIKKIPNSNIRSSARKKLTIIRDKNK